VRLRLLAAGLVLAAACRPGVPAEPPPNLLLVTLDTTRRDHLSVYGYERDTSPFLRRFAESGVRFERAYAPACVTAPSHATLFTGAYPIGHGVTKNAVPLANEHETLAERLRASGYQTAGVASSFVMDARFGWDQGFERWDDEFVPDETGWRTERWYEFEMEDGVFDRRADHTTDRALAWLRDQRDPARPFLLFVHYFDPHDPYIPPAPFDRRFATAPGEAPSLADALRGREFVDRYDGEIAFTDAELGRLVDGLDALGLAARTVVVVTADHGEGLLQHGQMTHGANVHEEAVRVPLLVRWTGRIAPGRTLDAPVEGVDLLPTLLTLAGAPADGALPGRSLAPALLGDGPLDPVRPVFLHRRPYDRQVLHGEAVDGEQFAVVHEGWKWIEGTRDGTRALYDLTRDPHETENVAEREPARARVLAERIAGWRARHGGAAPAAEVAPEDRARLRALGYAD
jgi:arylsulfatase A-like enzyme